MLRTIGFCLLIALQVVTSELPANCRGPPPGSANPHECCGFPFIFKDEDLKACELERSDLQKEGPPECSKTICLFQKYDMMKDDSKVNLEVIAAHLDDWVEKKSDYKEVLEKAKETCLKEDLPGPAQICQPNKVIMCSLFTIFVECPRWKDSDNCNILKDHIVECRLHFS